MSIIDVHFHLIGEMHMGQLEGLLEPIFRRFRVEWRAYTAEEALSSMDEAGIEKAVILPHLPSVQNEFVSHTARRYPERFVGFANVDVRRGVEVTKELEMAVKDLGLRGLKMLPSVYRYYPNSPQIYPVYGKCVELGIPVLIHTGTDFAPYSKIKYAKPEYLDDIAKDFPSLKIIGTLGWPWTEDLLAVVQRNDNVYFDLAGWAPRHLPDRLIQFVNSVIPDKTLFGTDSPALSPKRVVSEFNKFVKPKLKPESCDKILSGNASKLLKL